MNDLDREEHEFNCTLLAGHLWISDVAVFLSTLTALAHTHQVTIQALDADLIAGEEHLRAAVKKALRAIKRKRSITTDLGLEILVYASGRRQIERALELGVKAGEHTIVVVIVDVTGEKDLELVAGEVKRRIGLEEVPLGILDSGMTHPPKRARIIDFYNITPEEINAVGEQKLKLLVLERVALVDVLK